MLFKDHAQEKLNNKISKCEDCKLKDNPGPVLGYGNVNADVMFIADIPGTTEVKLGVPFTGKAKDNVVEMIRNAGLKKGEYYLTYLIKHTVTSSSAKGIQYAPCLDHLLAEIELINPKVICSMGFYSSQALIKHYKMEWDAKGIKAIHGQSILIPAKIRWNKILRPMRYLVPTWNPASPNEVINMYIKKDVFVIKDILTYSEILFNEANVSTQMSLDNCG